MALRRPPVRSLPLAGALCAFLVAAVARPVTAAQAEVTVPIVLSLGGLNGSYYTSELTLTNRGVGTVTVTFTYTAAFGGGSGSATDTLDARRQKIVPDAIAYLRARGVPIPGEGNRAGTLVVHFTGLAEDGEASANVRTTTAVEGGSAGLAYGAVGPAEGLTGPVYLCGLRQNDQDRSNIALLNVGAPGSGPVTLRATLFSGETGAAAEPIDLTLEPGAFSQLTEVLARVGLATAYARVDRVAGSAPYDAYAVINDQRNSDGSFVPALRPETLAGRRELTLPVVVETGAFSTELIVTSFAGPDRVLSLQYVAQAAHHIDVELPIRAGQQLILPEVVQYLRERTDAVPPRGVELAGAMFLFVPDGDVNGLFVGARAATPGGGGKYGLFYTAVPDGLALDGAAWLTGLQQNATNRTNVALINTGQRDASADVFRIEIFNGETGGLAARVNDILIHQKGWLQLNSMLGQYAPGVENAFARITRTSGNNPFVAYAVVNDGAGPGARSGDGAFLAGDPGCFFGVGPEALVVPAGGGAASIAVQTAGTCFWTASSDSGWVSLSAAFGTGSGTVTYTAAPNDGASRTAKLLVAGRRVDVTQEGNVACTFTVTPTTEALDAPAGNGTVEVATAAGCTWTATTETPWLRITAGTSGSGNGTVRYSFQANASRDPRTGTLNVAGRTVTLTQAGGDGPIY